VKWTPNFGPVRKVVDGACSLTERNRSHEERRCHTGRVHAPDPTQRRALLATPLLTTATPPAQIPLSDVLVSGQRCCSTFGEASKQSAARPRRERSRMRVGMEPQIGLKLLRG
jgi:hypothetical protein